MTLRASFLLTLVAVSFAIWTALRPIPAPPLTGTVDRIVIDKSDRTLAIWQDGRQTRLYATSLGFAPSGDKIMQGDGRTPEGNFRINRRNAGSRYHLSLGIDYPRPDDLARAQAGGYSAGGDIFIHGQPHGITGLQRIVEDWTAGCIAINNAAIEELWAVAPIGTLVEIRP